MDATQKNKKIFGLSLFTAGLIGSVCLLFLKVFPWRDAKLTLAIAGAFLILAAVFHYGAKKKRTPLLVGSIILNGIASGGAAAAVCQFLRKYPDYKTFLVFFLGYGVCSLLFCVLFSFCRRNLVRNLASGAIFLLLAVLLLNWKSSIAWVAFVFSISLLNYYCIYYFARGEEYGILRLASLGNFTVAILVVLIAFFILSEGEGLDGVASGGGGESTAEKTRRIQEKARKNIPK